MQIPEKYTRVSPIFLHAEEPLKVSLFIHMPLNKKVLLFLKKGEILSTEKLIELMKIPQSQIITSQEDAKNALDEVTTTIAKQLENSKSISIETSATASKMIQSFAAIDPSNLKESVVETKVILEESTIIVEKIISLLKASDAKSGFEQLRAQLKLNDDPLETHHRHTCALSVLLFLSFGEGTPSGVSDLAFAAMAHDLGLKHLPKNELTAHTQGDQTLELHASNPENDYSLEFEPIFKHIEETLKVLKKNTSTISENVFLTISQHHENYDGSGPGGISGKKIIPSARILRIADDLVALLEGERPEITTLENAINVLLTANFKTQESRFYDAEFLFQIQKTISGK